MADDYLTLGDPVFDQPYKFMCQYVNGKCSGAEPEWTRIPAAARTGLNNGCAATIGPHTPVDTDAKNDAKKDAKGVIRPFVNQYLRFPPVTNEDRTAIRAKRSGSVCATKTRRAVRKGRGPSGLCSAL
jgi:hypothetical protein